MTHAFGFSPDENRVQDFYRNFEKYRTTPLLLETLPGGTPFWIKDETDRMGMGAFKAVGGIYAVAKLVQERIWTATENAPRLEDLYTEKVREFASDLTFVCASAGNHGMAVATGARLIGAKARIYLSNAVSKRFGDRLTAAGAIVVRAGEFYDDSVAAALQDAEESGAILLADGSWENYTHPPSLVMEGYTIIAHECETEFRKSGRWPSHVYLQAGVGGIAAATALMIRKNWDQQPEIIIVEPDAAPCLRESARAGKLVTVEGPLSNMGRLDCKEASLIAFEALQQCEVSYEILTDEEAFSAAQDLQAFKLRTTPSGAAGFAAMRRSAQHRSPDFQPLVFVTEGPES
ncbi:MAG: pyridoxal-phosphate dependent enzyme [Sneathiellales bacterium]|nr:pyridoxal-phosphate dependent enzyme [Sneathiellales bacterium]